MNTEIRNARKLVFESLSDDNSYFRAECDLTTTHVDSSVTCSRSSSGSICNTSAVHHSVTTTIDGNWTVFDIGFLSLMLNPFYSSSLASSRRRSSPAACNP
ncbi:hypothetical protein HD806DRAFT_473307 [Xylariaceae sp. AK1471]|nr:hypothetical protein HD806DRAFT_473307 [Xylariaceae sp. AK1471]